MALKGRNTLSHRRPLKGWKQGNGAPASPLARLPPEIRGTIYEYAICILPFHLRRWICYQANTGPLSVFLASRAFYAEARSHCLHDRTFKFEVTGGGPLFSYRRSETVQDVDVRMSIPRGILHDARFVELRINMYAIQEKEAISAMLLWVRSVLHRRRDKLALLQLHNEVKIPWRTAMSVNEDGYREYEHAVDDGQIESHFACLHEIVRSMPCEKLQLTEYGATKSTMSKVVIGRLAKRPVVQHHETRHITAVVEAAKAEAESFRNVLRHYWGDRPPPPTGPVLFAATAGADISARGSHLR